MSNFLVKSIFFFCKAVPQTTCAVVVMLLVSAKEPDLFTGIKYKIYLYVLVFY